MSFMSRSCLLIAVVSVCATTATLSRSAEVGLKFSGNLLFVSEGSDPENGMTYGIRLPAFSPVSGHIVYESNTTGYSITSDTCLDCSAYHHKHINGLRVEFAGLTLQADEYIIEVQNDVRVTGGELGDVIQVWYPDQTNPTSRDLDEPLLINGTPYNRGSLLLGLIAPATTFSSSQLPPTLDPSLFIPSASAGTFGDGLPEHYILDVFFRPTSFSAFPHSTSDHDLDGDVDGADFLIWQRHAGTNSINGDANSDLVVDEQDLALWQAEYRSPVATLADNVAVPEPNVAALMVIMVLVGSCRR